MMCVSVPLSLPQITARQLAAALQLLTAVQAAEQAGSQPLFCNVFHSARADPC